MNCNDARPLLDLLCDGALETKDSALVLDHLKSCEECHSQWNELEDLHASFQDAKDKFQLPVGLMDRISDKLKDEDRNQRNAIFRHHWRAVSMVAFAATCLLVGLLCSPWMHPRVTVPSLNQIASADTLIDSLSSENLEPVEDRTELAKRVGYELKYLRLPEWRMDKSSISKSQSIPIARFDFAKKASTGDQYLSCYQAPEGAIRAGAGHLENLDGKKVLFGQHGKFQFALWSQSGRDYLFVTELSKPQLEDIVRGA
jgi:anti-sigma factor RsiW